MGTGEFDEIYLAHRDALYRFGLLGGTGSHAGAPGTCDLDDHLTDVALGTQQQTGSFTCAFTS